MATATKKISMAGDTLGTGRRKSAVARVRLREGKGAIMINKRPFEEYFTLDEHRNQVLAPLEFVGKRESLDITIRVHGGGNTGQAGACMLGIARALIKLDAELSIPLRQSHYLTRDPRMKERKKYGLHGARRGTQFSKR